MQNILQMHIEWLGDATTDFSQDILMKTKQSSGLAAHMILTKKTTSLSDQIGLIGAAAGLVGTIDQHPSLTIFLGLVILAAVSPVTLELVSDQEGEILGILSKIATGYIVDPARLLALCRIEPEADACIDVLCEKGFLRRSERNGVKILRIQRPLLKNINVSFIG